MAILNNLFVWATVYIIGKHTAGELVSLWISQAIKFTRIDSDMICFYFSIRVHFRTIDRAFAEAFTVYWSHWWEFSLMPKRSLLLVFLEKKQYSLIRQQVRQPPQSTGILRRVSFRSWAPADILKQGIILLGISLFWTMTICSKVVREIRRARWSYYWKPCPNWSLRLLSVSHHPYYKIASFW